jgi:ATP-binding protein involved in chromosome partitioning
MRKAVRRLLERLRVAVGLDRLGVGVRGVRSVSRNCFVKVLQIDGENVSFAIELTTPACPVRDQMKEDAHRAVLALPGVTKVEVAMTSKVRGTQSEQTIALIPLVKNVVPVASGKGGVG